MANGSPAFGQYKPAPGRRPRAVVAPGGRDLRRPDQRDHVLPGHRPRSSRCSGCPLTSTPDSSAHGRTRRGRQREQGPKVGRRVAQPDVTSDPAGSSARRARASTVSMSRLDDDADVAFDDRCGPADGCRRIVRGACQRGDRSGARIRSSGDGGAVRTQSMGTSSAAPTSKTAGRLENSSVRDDSFRIATFRGRCRTVTDELFRPGRS